jgi:membrane protein
MNPKTFYQILLKSIIEFNRDRVPRLGAALAFYTLSSIAPLIVVAVGIGGLLLRGTNLQTQISDAVSSSLGETVAISLNAFINTAAQPQTSSSLTATVIGAALALFLASGIFLQIQDALNTMWDLHPPPYQKVPWWTFLWARFWSIVAVVVFGLVMIGFLAARVTLIAFEKQLNLAEIPYVLTLSNSGLSIALFTLLFGLILKYLPDIRLPWRDVLLGAFVTSLLFTFGQYLIGEYIARATLTSVYGAAGSLVVLLLWVYYSSQILLFGAEVTWVYANSHGTKALRQRLAAQAREREILERLEGDIEKESYRPPPSRASVSMVGGLMGAIVTILMLPLIIIWSVLRIFRRR